MSHLISFFNHYTVKAPPIPPANSVAINENVAALSTLEEKAGRAETFSKDGIAISTIINRSPHVGMEKGKKPSSHFMIAPKTSDFQPFKLLTDQQLLLMTTAVMSFLKHNSNEALVLGHESSDRLVMGPKAVVKSWKQPHWHFRIDRSEPEKVKFQSGEENPKLYGETLIQLFNSNLARLPEINNLNPGEAKTYGYDLAFEIDEPSAFQLATLLKILDQWVDKVHPRLQQEFRANIPDDRFMDEATYTFAIRKSQVNEDRFEIAILPHLKSPKFAVVKAGDDKSTIEGVTIEPFGRTLLRHTDEKHTEVDQERVKESMISMRSLLEHLDTLFKM